MELNLTKIPLFTGIRETELISLLGCLQSSRLKCKKGDLLLQAGSPARGLGLVLAGSVTVEQLDVWGNRNIMGRMDVGQVFAEAYACTPGEPLMVDVTAEADGEILFLQVDKLLTVCSNTCSFHGRLIQNLLQIMAVKNLNLTRKIRYITPKTIREKLLAYLSDEALRAGKNEFVIPFDRQALADYLCVERSALSAALSKLKQEGLLWYRKNRFILRQER